MAGKIKQWASRLTGISTPVFGVSWQPTAAERDIAVELIAHLEDRRVLYNPSYAEDPHHCVTSVIEIRRMLSGCLVEAGAGSVLAEHIRALAAASRRFLDRLGADGRASYRDMASQGHYLSWEFQDALGQLRGVFGVHIAMIAARFGLDVGNELSAIMPAPARADDLDRRLDRY